MVVDSLEPSSAIIRFAMRESGYKRRARNLLFLVHVRDSWEAGLSEIEESALTEVCRRCGASQVRLLDQPFELAPPQLLEMAKGRM
jgi:hypothetical protein